MFVCFFFGGGGGEGGFDEGIQIPLKAAISGPPAKRHLNGGLLACQ